MFIACSLTLHSLTVLLVSCQMLNDFQTACLVREQILTSFTSTVPTCERGCHLKHSIAEFNDINKMTSLSRYNVGTSKGDDCRLFLAC